MKWFKTVFLPSLEEQYNKRGGKMWLTKKQTDVCRSYMDASYTVRGCYYYVLGNKKYTIQIAPNGCAHFSIMVNGYCSQ